MKTFFTIIVMVLCFAAAALAIVMCFEKGSFRWGFSALGFIASDVYMIMALTDDKQKG